MSAPSIWLPLAALLLLPVTAPAEQIDVPGCVVALDSEGNVYRTAVWNDHGGSLSWVVTRDSEVILERAADREYHYKPARDVAGNYSVHVAQFHNGAYRVISNIVYFRIEPGRVLTRDDKKDSGQDEVHLFLGHKNRVSRSLLADEQTANIVWAVRHNGRLVLKRNARNSTQVRYYRHLPGRYEVELYRNDQGVQQLISNTATYEIR